MTRTTCGLAALLLSLASACDDNAAQPPAPVDRILFPTGLALSPATDPSRDLYIANSNADRSYETGALLQIPIAAFDGLPAGARIPAAGVIASAGALDSFAGELLVDADVSAVYATARDHDTLSRAPLVDGKLTCPGTPADCSADALDLAAFDMTQPFGLAQFDAVVPGESGPVPVLAVAHVAPVSIGRLAEAKNAFLAVVRKPTPGVAGASLPAPAYTVDLGAYGAGSLAFDPVSNQLLISGCYERVHSTEVLVCSDLRATAGTINPLRSIDVGAGAQTTVMSTELGAFLGGSETTDLALSSDGTTLYVATGRQNPNATGANALLVIDLPRLGGPPTPTLRATVPLAEAPTRITVLARPDGDLIAATATASDALLIVDPRSASVVAQVQPVGRNPYGLASLATPSGTRIFVGLFRDCAVAAVDVPAASPWDATVAATIGGCP